MKAHLTNPCSRGLFSPDPLTTVDLNYIISTAWCSLEQFCLFHFISKRQLLSVYSYDFKSGIKCKFLFPKKNKEKSSRAKLWHETKFFFVFFFAFWYKALTDFHVVFFSWKILLLFDQCPNTKKNNNKITSVQTCCWIFSFNPPFPLIFRWWYEGWKALIIFKEIITRDESIFFSEFFEVYPPCPLVLRSSPRQTSI